MSCFLEALRAPILALALMIAPGQQLEPLSKAELLDLLDSGVSEVVVKAMVNSSCVSFELTPETAKELSASVPEEILLAAIECEVGSSSPDSVVAEPTLRKPAWEAAYGTIGFVYHLPLSSPKGQIVAALGGRRSSSSPLACEVDQGVNFANISPDVLEAFAIKGEELIGEALGVFIGHGLSAGFLHLLAFQDRESAIVAYNGIDAALTRSYGHPPRKPFKIEDAKASGYLARKLFGAVIPGDTKKKAGWGSGMIESNMYLGHHKKTGRWTIGVITLDHALNK